MLELLKAAEKLQLDVTTVCKRRLSPTTTGSMGSGGSGSGSEGTGAVKPSSESSGKTDETGKTDASPPPKVSVPITAHLALAAASAKFKASLPY